MRNRACCAPSGRWMRRASCAGSTTAIAAHAGVADNSQVETYAAVRLFVDSWRWADVPFYIRAGKCMPVTSTEVVVEFRRPPREVFGELVPSLSSHLRLRLSPGCGDRAWACG